MKSSEINLGAFVLNTRAGHLKSNDGKDCELRYQTRKVLAILAEKPGEVVSKAAFLEAVWDGAHVSEDSLVQCIAEIRQAIGDGEKAIIETIPRKGYRLVPTGNGPRSWMRSWHLKALIPVAALVVAAAFWQSSSLETAPRVIAVLPFQDDSIAQYNGELGDLISAGILVNLARFPQLTVIARNSSFRFRDQAQDIPEIARQLGADFVLEGSQQFDGDQLRVTAQLIDVKKNSRIWSDQIDTEISDLLKVSTLISNRVAFSVEAFLADTEVKASGVNEVDAVLLSHKARRLQLSKLSKENVEEAISIGRESIRLYPEEAWGHASLAFSLRTKLRFGWAGDPEKVLQEALGHAQKAVSLAPDNYVAHFALGRVRMQQGNQIGAIQAFETALRINPSSADILNALALSYLYLGQNDRALEALAQSARIDPLPGFVYPWMRAWALWQVRECDDALESFSRIASPPAEAHKLLTAIQVCRGEMDKANKALETFLVAEPDWTISREKDIHFGRWIAEGALDRWLADLATAGLPGE